MNFGVNKGILIAGFIIVTLSIANQMFVHNTGTNITKILVGAYVALLILALVDIIPGMSSVTTGIAMLALVTTILMYGGGLLGVLSKPIGTPSPATLPSF